MKKIISIILSITMLTVSLAGCSKSKGETTNQTKIAIVTEDKKTDARSYTAAEDIKSTYAIRKENGDLKAEVEHFTISKETKNNENIIKKIIEDKDIKAAVFAKYDKEILTAIKEIKSKREDMILFGANMDLTVKEMSDNLDLSYISSKMTSGADTVKLAKEMGSEVFVLYYSDKDLKENEELNKKIEEIKSECTKQDMEFVNVKVRDIASKDDEYKVKKEINEDLEKQIYKFGRNINVLGTNKTMDDVLIRRAIKSKLIVAESSEGCLADYLNDLYRNIVKTADHGNYRSNSILITYKNANYDMRKRVGGLIMPNDIFAIYAATDTALMAIETNANNEKLCKSYFSEQSAFKIDGLTGTFVNAEKGINNVKIVANDQLIY